MGDKKLDVAKIQKWVEEHAEGISELIPVEVCPSHDNGMETCWGQDGHLWLNSNQQILTICHPKQSEVFETA